jgi:hypothetical protein
MSPADKIIILDKIRETIGKSKYGELVITLGEDGLIDLFLDQINKELAVSSTYSPTYSPKNGLAEKIKKAGKTVVSIIPSILFLGVLWGLIFLGDTFKNEWYGKFILSAILVFWGIVYKDEPIFWPILLFGASVVLFFWGVIQGLIILFS